MTTYPHPACMEPDGGDGPCAGYNALVAENERLAALLVQCIEYVEIYADTIRHEPWKQNALNMIAAIQALPQVMKTCN